MPAGRTLLLKIRPSGIVLSNDANSKPTATLEDSAHRLNPAD